MSTSKKRSRTGKLLLDREIQKTPSKDISTPEPVAQSSPKTPKWRNRKYSGKDTGKRSKDSKEVLGSNREWSVEFICGGKFQSKSLFSKDEKFLFVATDKAVKVYNTLNGHCVRSISGVAGEKHKLVDFVLDPGNEFRILVVFTNARVRVYDWTDGLLITQYKLKEVPRMITVLDNSTLLLLSKSSLRYCSLPFPTSSKEEIIKLPVHELLDLGQDQSENTLLAVDTRTSTVCIASGKTIRFGTLQEKGDNLKDRVSWRDLVIDTKVVSLACSSDILVIGETSGRIRVFFEMGSENGDMKPTETITSWHQSPVTALQITTNGRYILSGGGEETMVITQITSGAKQFVPRLGGDVIGINQTPSGSQYSISLSNNTIKIISAGDLDSVSEISGIISPSSSTASKPVLAPSTVALLQPHHSNLYINGPVSSPSSSTLQCYDLLTDRQSLRFETSLTSRTKWTGKEKRPVLEPQMTCAQFTADGDWLATVEEWEDKYALDEVSSYEVFLKIWRWREKGWDLVAKIENPHGIDGHVLGISSPATGGALKGSDNNNREFATLGSEGSIKIWRAYKNSHGNVSETIWSLYRTIGSSTSITQIHGAIIYSPDNSVLIAGVGGYIHLINATSGHLVKSLHLGHSINKLDILGRHLISLHDNMSIFSGWDLSSGQIVFSERLDRPHSSIAVNPLTSTMAIASASEKGKSNITISSMTMKGKVNKTKISVDSAVSHLLSTTSNTTMDGLAGFLFVDNAGQVGHITNLRASQGSAPLRPVATDYSVVVPRSKFISGHVTRTDGDARKRKRMQTTMPGVTMRDKDISQVLQMEGLDIMQMYETILQNGV